MLLLLHSRESATPPSILQLSMFKFMALYSFIEFCSALILYRYDSNLGDFQYLYIDLVLVLLLAVVMGRYLLLHSMVSKNGRTKPYERLVAERPTGR